MSAPSGKWIRVHRASGTLEYGEGATMHAKWDAVVGNEGGTPLGSHKVLLKDATKKSEKYNHAPMPWSLKFTSDYCAIHGTNAATLRSWAQYFGVPDVGTHGCVGLPDDKAKALFDWAPIGTPVTITDD